MTDNVSRNCSGPRKPVTFLEKVEISIDTYQLSESSPLEEATSGPDNDAVLYYISCVKQWFLPACFVVSCLSDQP